MNVITCNAYNEINLWFIKYLPGVSNVIKHNKIIRVYLNQVNANQLHIVEFIQVKHVGKEKHLGNHAGFNVSSVVKRSVLDVGDLLLMNHEEEEDRTRNPNQEILSVKFTEKAF